MAISLSALPGSTRSHTMFWKPTNYTPLTTIPRRGEYWVWEDRPYTRPDRNQYGWVTRSAELFLNDLYDAFILGLKNARDYYKANIKTQSTRTTI